MLTLKKCLTVLAVSVSLIAAEGALAEKAKKGGKKKGKKTEEAGGSYRAPYGMAGCGLGSLVIKEDKMAPQIGATLLNATGTQTFAITTGSSNCVLVKDDVAMMEQEVFVSANLNSLQQQAAQGEGEHLFAFSQILGCDADYAEFQAVSRAHYAEIFADGEAKGVLTRYVGAVRANDKLAKGCARLVMQG